jgi:hypothetical protein
VEKLNNDESISNDGARTSPARTTFNDIKDSFVPASTFRAKMIIKKTWTIINKAIGRAYLSIYLAPLTTNDKDQHFQNTSPTCTVHITSNRTHAIQLTHSLTQSQKIFFFQKKRPTRIPISRITLPFPFL